MERKITPMFKVGKNIAESSNPARIVLRRLQHPKNKPINAANVTVDLPRGGTVFFRVINTVSSVLDPYLKYTLLAMLERLRT